MMEKDAEDWKAKFEQTKETVEQMKKDATLIKVMI